MTRPGWLKLSGSGHTCHNLVAHRNSEIIMSHPGRVIRTFGTWELVLADLSSGQKVYVNKASGEISEDPPDEVLEVIASENSQRRKPEHVYDVKFHFKTLRQDSDQGSEPGAPDRDVEPDLCRLCCDVGQVDGLGVCPLCDGEGLASIVRHESVLAQVPLLDGDGSAFLLRNLLSRGECEDIIRQAEGFGLQDCGYNRRIRVTDRVVILGEDLARLLFERARPYLADVRVPRLGRKGPRGLRDVARPGLWRPVGLNPCFRVCRYSPGGFFLPHHDGGFDIDEDHLSLQTFMLYLNDGFEGAPTSFYSNKQSQYSSPKPENVIYELNPERGSCVVFNHCILHDGGELKNGTKYILRSELMFQWVGLC
mmetsp:Transcript_20106/g.69746  ORF Transcript_20106/g.69746 Transcript_20106/m.69746 type:complete len:366 (-) Transcript_20106:184-1281(-)